MSQTREDRAIAVGKFGRPHGTRGELRLWTYNADSALFGQVFEGWIEAADGRHDITVKEVRWADRFAIVKLDGVRRREQAEPFKNQELFVSRDLLPEPAEDEFYLIDSIGWPVLLEVEGELVEVGAVTGFVDAGAGEILRVELTTENTFLVPLLDHVVTEMSPDSARVVVAPLDTWAPEGSEALFGDLFAEEDEEETS